MTAIEGMSAQIYQSRLPLLGRAGSERADQGEVIAIPQGSQEQEPIYIKKELEEKIREYMEAGLFNKEEMEIFFKIISPVGPIAEEALSPKNHIDIKG